MTKPVRTREDGRQFYFTLMEFGDADWFTARLPNLLARAFFVVFAGWRSSRTNRPGGGG